MVREGVNAEIEFHSGDGDDTLAIYGTGGSRVELHGDAGEDDLLTGSAVASFVHIEGGDDNDTIILEGPGASDVDGGAGNDRITTGPGDDLIHGGAGIDTISAGAGADEVYGDEGDDELNWTFGDENDVVWDGGTGTGTGETDGDSDTFNVVLTDAAETDIQLDKKLKTEAPALGNRNGFQLTAMSGSVDLIFTRIDTFSLNTRKGQDVVRIMSVTLA